MIVAPIEVNKRRRGHRFYPPQAVARKIPALYATENHPLTHRVAHVHYFTPSRDIYIIELDPESGRAFALITEAGQHEWGYVSLPEMEAVNVRPVNAPFGIVIERDCYWTPVLVASLIESSEHGQVTA